MTSSSTQWGFRVLGAGDAVTHEYIPTPKQFAFHNSSQPNVLYIGSRGTGKSLALRNEAHMRALSYPGFPYAIVRRTMPELKKSHLTFIDAEMKAFGGHFNKTDSVAYYPNGSKGFYSHCSDDTELGNLLSAEFYWLGIDEWSTIPWETTSKLRGSVRVPKNSGLIAMVRGATNPIGTSASELRKYFIDHDVDPESDPDYIPSDWFAVTTTLKDNPHIDEIEYRKQFSGLPPHVRKAWLDGEFVVEGAYFLVDPQSHFITEAPSLLGRFNDLGECLQPAPFIYRAIDHGWHDATVCLWLASYPNGRTVVFKERSWTHTTAQEIAKAIKIESAGMRITDTLCDPTMFSTSESTGSSVGDVIEQYGVPLSKSKNDRTAAGYAISEYLNTTLPDGLPKLQLYTPGCPMLTKTLPAMRIDPTNVGRIADDKQDHWPIALSYYCMGATATPRLKHTIERPYWTRQTTDTQFRLGSESVGSRK